MGIPFELPEELEEPVARVVANTRAPAAPSVHDEPEAAHALAILATAADAIIGVDRDGNVVTVNPATTSVFGVQPEEVIGQPLTTMVPALTGPAIAQAIRDGIWLHVSQCFVARQQITGLRVGGVEFPIDVSIGEVPGEGRVKYACTVRDITEAKLAEESLNLFSRALECSHNAVMICDASRATKPIVFVNPAFTRVTGYRLMDVLGRAPTFLIGDDQRQHELKMMQQALDEGGEVTVTLRCYRNDGERFHGQMSVSPVRDSQDRITHFIVIMSDVSERVRAERALAERGARLDAIFELSPDGFALFDRDDRLVFVNPALQEMTGQQWRFGPDGMKLAVFDARLRDLCDEASPYPLLGEDHGDTPARLHLVRPVVRVVERELRRNAQGHGETILYFRDVTRETEVDRMKSEFLSTAAHELRTPLASIFGFTELLLKRRYPEERQRDMLGTMHRQAALLIKLLNELLDLARIEARQGKDFRIVEQALEPVVNASIKGLMLPEGERQVQVRLEAGLSVLADADKLSLALGNLLGNAYKYSPDGGSICLNARAEHYGGRDYAVIEVVDHGLGMTPAQLKRAFDRFWRADPSGNIPGTGLGLSLVKEIVELHDGYVELASEPGRGTTAQMWIPAGEE